MDRVNVAPSAVLIPVVGACSFGLIAVLGYVVLPTVSLHATLIQAYGLLGEAQTWAALRNLTIAALMKGGVILLAVVRARRTQSSRALSAIVGLKWALLVWASGFVLASVAVGLLTIPIDRYSSAQPGEDSVVTTLGGLFAASALSAGALVVALLVAELVLSRRAPSRHAGTVRPVGNGEG